MEEEIYEKLKKTTIPEEAYEYAYVKDGIIYSPLIENGEIVKTGLERYEAKFLKQDNIKESWFDKIKKLFKGGKNSDR